MKKKKYFTDEYSNEEAQIKRASDIPRMDLREEIANEIEAKKKAESDREMDNYMKRLKFKKDMRRYNRVMGNEADYMPEDLEEYRKQALKRISGK